ncbi:cardiomyopathy-associated protein 5 [Phascolarctos cinereus]|uniref:Cardiomyopathy-associated protein 5 n=1 Tax=Phascolarctos cinereus TaxID=38626 RepID=A0A6P5L7V2_PHACI|nr:cardiomyopathy-associated protein 5 [Phascolarctos cinereus]
MESAQYDPAPTSDSYLGSEEETELETEEESEGEEETTAETEEELDSSRLTDQNEEDKTKQQCIISDPSFSMVTVQREDSGITWETSSSRSSTPWASESSLTSDMYSMEGSTVSSPPGNISFILDEGKKVRKRTRKSSSKHGSPALRRKGGKKRHSLEGQEDVPANAKDKASISDGKSKQEKSSIGAYDKNRKKKTISNTPPITGAIYKEHKPLVLRPVYIGTVQYKIKMFNSVKEEIIPLQFYGTLPKGYVIKEINYRKGKDASITLEPDVTNQDPSIASKASKPMTQNIESNKEKQLSPPWREAMSKESRPVPSFLKDIEKPKEADSYSPLNAAAACVLKHTVSSYSSNETMVPQSLPLSASTLPVEEASMQEIQMDSPDAATSELMAPKMEKEEFKADMQQAVVSSPTLSMPPSFVDEVREEERESDLLATAATYISETLTSTKAEEEAFESDSPVTEASAPGPFGIKVNNLGLSSLEKEEPVFPTGEGEMEETKPESSVSLSEPPALGKMKEEEEGVSLPITSGPEFEPSYVSEEEIIEIDYPESLSPSENAIPPHLVHERERKEAEPDLPLLATSTSEHVALLEKEREEIGPISPDSDFASEFSSLSYSTHELEEKETKPVSPPAVISASEYEILSEEETMPHSPEFTSVSEYSTYPTVEEESTGCETPTHLASTSEATIFSEEETLESECYTPDSTSASEYSVPVYAAQEQKEETSQQTPLNSVAAAEHMIISEEEKDYIGPFSPDSAFASEYSFSPHEVRESEKEEFERDYPPCSTSPSEHTILTEEENEEIEPFSPDSASDFSVPLYITPEPEKKDDESGSLQTAISVSEYSIFSEAEKEETETQAPTMPEPQHTILSQRQKAQHSSSVPGSEQLNLPPSTAEVEKGEVKPSSQTTSLSVSEYLILSQKRNIEGLSQVLESEHSISPSSTDEREKEETKPDPSVPAFMKAGSSEKEKIKPVLPETSVTRPQESIPAESTQEVKKELGLELAHAQKGASDHLSFSKVSKEEITSNSQVTPPEYPASLQHKEMEPHSPKAPEYVMEPSVAPGEAGKKVVCEPPVPQQETSLKNKENLKDMQKAKSLAGLVVSRTETKEKIREDEEQAVVPESQHLVLSESKKEETPPPPELKFSSLSEEDKKEIGPDSPQATVSELKPSLLPKVVKEEIQSDSPLPTTSVFDSVLSKASKEEVDHSSPLTEHLVLNEKEKKVGEPGLSPIETTASKSPIWPKVHKEEVNFHASPNARYSAEHAVLSEVGKEEEKPGSPVPEHSASSKAGSDQGVPPVTVTAPECSTLSKKQASESSDPASMIGGSVPPYMAVEIERKDTKLPSSKTVISASDQGVPSQEKEEIKYPPHELETLETEELSMKSVTPTGERSRQEPGMLISDKSDLPSEKPAVPSSSLPVEPEKTGMLPDALELSGAVSELSHDLVSESEHRDAKLEISLTSETGSSVLERAKSEAKTREEGKQEHKPFSAEVASMASDKSVASFIEKENPEPQQDHFSFKELLQESRDLADSNKGEKQKGHPLTSIENLAPQGAGDILTKANEDTTQTHSFHMSENVPEPSKMASSDLSEEQAKQETILCPDDVGNLLELSIPSLNSPLADQQDISTKSHSFAEANLPLEESKSIVTIEPGDVMDAKDSLPLQKEGSWLLKEPSQEQASPDKERVLESGQPCSSATDGRLSGHLTSAPPEKKQTYEHTKPESFYPAKEPALSAEGPSSPLGRSDDHGEKLTTQTYSSPEIQVAEEPRGTVLVENIARPEAKGKQLSLSVDSESVIPEKLGTEEDGQEKFTPASESTTKIRTQVSGDPIMKQVKPEIIPSSVKATSRLAEDSVTALGSEKEELGITSYSSTEKRLLKESKADASKVVENADEAQQSESEKPLPEATISMHEKSKLSLIQSGEITAPLDSPKIINKVPEQAEIAAPSTVTNGKAKKGISSFTSWMARLFFGASAPENDVDEKEAQPSPAADTAVLEEEVKMTLSAATEDFNEAEKPALSPLSVSGLSPEKEPKVIVIKASEEREQKEIPLTLPNQVDKEPSKLTLLRGEKASQKSEPLPTHHLPESGLLSEAESRTALTESGKPRQSKEEPMFLLAVEETPPDLSKPISGSVIEEHKIPENRKEEMQPLSGIEVEMPSELASIKVTSAQNRTYLENQPPVLGKQLVLEEAENGAPVHITGENRVQKAEIYTHSETSQLTEESKNVLTYLNEQHDQEKTLFSAVEVDQVIWSAKSTPSEFASERTMKESAKLESRTLTMEESKDSLIKVGDDRPEKEMPKAVSSTFYDDEPNLKTISSTDEEKVLEQKPYRITEKAVLAEKSEMAVPLILRETKEIRMAGLLRESELHKAEYSKEAVVQFCENKEDRGMVAKIPTEVSIVSEVPKSTASIPSENQLTSAERGMREDSKPHPILESREVSEELGMTLGSSVDESQPLSFAKADFFKESQIVSAGPTERNKEESCQSPLTEKEKLILGRSDAVTVSLEKEGEQKVSLPNLSPGENNQMTPTYSAGGTNFASEESTIPFGISHDESENLKNQAYSLAKAKSVTGESQMVLSVAHPETKETKTVGIQPTSLSETDSLEEKTRTFIPSSPGHRVEVDQEDICALPDIGSLMSKISSHNEEKEQYFLSSDISHAMAKPSKEALPGITKESKKQEPQPKLGIFGKLVSRESKITLDRPFDETENLDQLSSFQEAIFSPVKSPAVISVSSPAVNVSEISEISPPELTVASQAHQTKDGTPDSPMPPTFVSKQVSDSQTKPMGDLQVDRPYPSAIRDSDHVTCDIPSTNDEAISSTEGIAKEPENLFVKDGAFAAPVVTSKPPGLTEDQKNAFSIISEGCEILNIHAPAFISSVDEEECEKMQDKLEYLEEKTSQSIRPFHDGSKVTIAQETEMRNESHADHLDADVSLEKGQMQEKTHLAEEDTSTDSDVAFSYHTMPSDVDYFEKYTLIDYNITPEPLKKESFEKQDIEREPQKKVPEETISFPESSADKTLEYEFDLVKLDESFYGMEKDDSKVSYTESHPSLPTLRSTDSETPRDVARDVESKSPGMPLFNAEEGVLSRTQLFPTEVKAINPELLEEPPALAFLYKDLYEEAVGDKKQEGETTSDRESLNSDASFPSRHSDAEEGTGIYFEKYILKDDILHDASGYQKDQSQPLEEKPVGKDDSCQLIAGEGEVWGRFGTILGERSMEEEQKAMFSEGELRSSVETCKDGELQGKVPITEEVQLASQKISYAVPFQDKHHILERVDEPDGQGNEEENASPEASQHFPVEVSYPEEELMSGATPAPESLQVEPQLSVPAEMTEARPCSSPVQDEYEFAELMNYEVVTQEDLLSDDLFSESTPEDVLSQGKKSFELIGENDEFAKQAEQIKSVLQKDSGSEIVEPERLLAEVKDAQKETKKSQIDTYCYTCKCPISAIDKIFGAHKDHEVAALDTAIDVVKIQLGEFLENLKEKSLKIEAFVTEIESFFNTIEENCSKNEKRLEEQNEEMMKKVLAQYDEKAQSFEEVKKRKMEYLHEQMVNFLQSMDTAKETLETIVKEAEELDETVFLTSFKEINDRLLSAMESTASLENVPTAFSLFEHYDDSSTRSDQMLKHVAVPQPPILEPQEPNSATSTTITVYWSVRKEDVIDSFQVYCMEEPQEDSEANDLVEEYRLTVKESYCLFEDLEPGRCYQVWVMAVNFTGCSLPSERATFKTAPSTPIIKAEECTVCWNTAIIRWSSANPGAADAYTLEYCRQHSPEGEGLRSYSGIKGFQLKVNLQPNDNYFFYAKAVNAFGTSEQSEAALISTRGTRFLLLRETAHPALQISSDGTVIRLTERRRLTATPSVLGEQLPACGQHYWETTVTDCPAYRLGICSSSNTQSVALGQGDASWYMHCSEPQRYTFFSNGTVSNVHVTEHPVRVGILLDYSNQRLLFINAESGQLLFTIRHRFTGPIHPAFALEKPGQFTLHLGKEPPDFLRHK